MEQIVGCVGYGIIGFIVAIIIGKITDIHYSYSKFGPVVFMVIIAFWPIILCFTIVGAVFCGMSIVADNIIDSKK